MLLKNNEQDSVDIVGEEKNKLLISFFFGNHCTEKDQEADHAPSSTNLKENLAAAMEDRKQWKDRVIAIRPRSIR